MKRQRPLPLQALISSLLHVLPSFYHTVPLQSQEREIYILCQQQKKAIWNDYGLTDRHVRECVTELLN